MWFKVLIVVFCFSINLFKDYQSDPFRILMFWHFVIHFDLFNCVKFYNKRVVKNKI